MDNLIRDYHGEGVTRAWLERLAIFVLGSKNLDELSLAWFAQYLTLINAEAKKCTDLWPPVLVALSYLQSRCPALQRAVSAISA